MKKAENIKRLLSEPFRKSGRVIPKTKMKDCGKPMFCMLLTMTVLFSGCGHTELSGGMPEDGVQSSYIVSDLTSAADTEKADEQGNMAVLTRILPAGTYEIEETGHMTPGKYCIYGDDDGKVSLAVKNANGKWQSCYDGAYDDQTYITVKAGEKITFTGKAVEEQALEKSSLTEVETAEGMYLCGTDLPAGKYVVKPEKENAWYGIYQDSGHTADSCLEEGEISGEVKITLKDGQYVSLRNASLKKQRTASGKSK